MTVFVKLGGCNGSGKTSVVRAIVEGIGLKAATNQKTGKVDWYAGYYTRNDDFNNEISTPITVLGNYASACGGMDTINNKEAVRELFERAAKRPGIVIGEGLIFGKTYGHIGGRLFDLSRKGKLTALWAFMGTPFEECVERVENRRAVAAALKGKDPELLPVFDPERTMRMTYTIMERLEAGVRNGKYPIGPRDQVMSLAYKPGRQPATDAKLLLKKALEMHNANG